MRSIAQVSCFEGGKVLRVDPELGTIIGKVVVMPLAYLTTSVCFGGTDFETLYITTAQFPPDEIEQPEQTHPGHLFAARISGVRGRRQIPFGGL